MKKLVLAIIVATFSIYLQSGEKEKPQHLTPREQIRKLYEKVKPTHQRKLKKIIK